MGSECIRSAGHISRKFWVSRLNGKWIHWVSMIHIFIYEVCTRSGVGIAQFNWQSTGLVIRRSWVQHLSPGRSSRIFFSSPELTCCANSNYIIWCSSHPRVSQRHEKDPGHSAKRAGGRLHLNMHTPVTQWSWSGLTMKSWHSVGNYQGNELTCRNCLSQSSQLAEPL